MRPGLLAITGFVLVTAAPALAGTIKIDFDSYGTAGHGRIIDNEYASNPGLGMTVRVVNPGTNPDYAVLYNSNLTGGPVDDDPDLLNPWNGGNLASTTDLGNLLIIQEHTSRAELANGFDTDPDDEGSRPAGDIYFSFDRGLTAFGLTLVDIEDLEAGPGTGFVATFMSGGSALATIDFAQFISGGAFDNGAVWGNNSANAIAPITATQLSTFTGTTITSFDSVRVHLHGSGGIADITAHVVPLPPAAWMGLGLLGVMGLVRRRRQSRR